jgi:hypothetical protein
VNSVTSLVRLRRCAPALTMTGALALTACSAGSSIPGVPSSVDAPANTPRAAKATLTIRWASTKARNAALPVALWRRPHFISPGAKSIEIYAALENDPSKPLATIVNKPKSGASSTVSIDAPVGRDAFAFGVYDQAGAKGNEIGGAQVLQTIVAGKANVLKVTLDG